MLVAIWACSLCWPLEGQSPAPCRTADLTIEMTGEGAAMGEMSLHFVLTNRGHQTCSLIGAPSAAALNSKREIVHDIVFDRGPAMGEEDDHTAQLIRMNPGDRSWFEILTRDTTGTPDDSFCRKATRVRITPPQNRQAFKQSFRFFDCVPRAYVSFLEAQASN